MHWKPAEPVDLPNGHFNFAIPVCHSADNSQNINVIDFKTLNQLFLAILGVMLASLLVGSLLMQYQTGRNETTKFWRLSLGARSASYFLWAALPLATPLFSAVANMLFVFSAGCLALLYRSWRVKVSREALLTVVLCALLIGGLHLVVQRVEGNYVMRMLVTGIAGVIFSIWELTELIRLGRKGAEALLKLIIGIVLFQKLLSIAALAMTLQSATGEHRFLIDNSTNSIYLTWCVLSIHLIIYLITGSYLYRKAMLSQLNAVKEKDELKSLLEEREKLLSSLIVVNRVTSSGALSESLAHELSPQLTTALTQLGVMKHIIENKKEADRTLSDLLDNVTRDIAQLRQILENIRGIFRQRPQHMKSCDLMQVLSQGMMIMKKRLEDANVRVILTDGPPIMVDIVEAKIQQVLINLLDNAADSLEKMTGSSKTIWIDVNDVGERVIISISDNGPGVSPELVDEIFDLTRSGKDRRMGIGLWISKHIVEERHQGRLWLDTLFAPGARFVMELPKHSTIHSRDAEQETSALMVQ